SRVAVSSCCYPTGFRLSEFGAYVAVAAYPIIGIFVFDWWNAGWASEHHSFNLPLDLKKKREDANRPLLLVKYFLLLLALRCLTGGDIWRLFPIATHLKQLLVPVVWGIGGGTAMLAFRY